ncbi:MAG: hypothetical protein PWP65_1345 [Clostridia bacterium]|nr:hypothetical protein [Clostridia bacterium]
MRKRELVIDRLEKEAAVITDGRNTFCLPRDLLPIGAREGDVIKLAVALDPEATARRRQETAKTGD